LFYYCNNCYTFLAGWAAFGDDAGGGDGGDGGGDGKPLYENLCIQNNHIFFSLCFRSQLNTLILTLNFFRWWWRRWRRWR